MKITPVRGMNDYLPTEVRIRDYLQNQIIRVYKENGFEHITTPILEDLNNLQNSDGGDNLSLIFNVLKRGEKLKKILDNNNVSQNDLCDSGLRYDLTLPLSRYYSNNRDKLLMPFKCIQIDRVYRAERPQKGRLREFIQCDIDIIGSESINSEIELITVTAKALLALGIENFTVKINDRQLLSELLLKLGFNNDQIKSVCTTIDKLNKIGLQGISQELTEKGFDKDSVSNLISFINRPSVDFSDVIDICGELECIKNLNSIIKEVDRLANSKYDIKFDISLIRGQGYYTGTIFEIYSKEFRNALAGGGRYDNLIGNFLSEMVPAVGFSIGFERIFQLLYVKGINISNIDRPSLAVIYDAEDFFKAYLMAEKYRKDYNVSLFECPK